MTTETDDLQIHTKTMINGLKQNLRLRLDTAKQMLVGGGFANEMTPMDRRRRILNDTREKVLGEDEASGSSSGGDYSGGSTRTRTRSSDQISTSGNSTQSGGGTTQSGAPSMSNAQRGTAKRAEEYNS